MLSAYPKGLYRDRWFWLALVVGLPISWCLARFVASTEIAGARAEQWQTLLWLVLLYPIIEEWLFRGVLQGQLLRWHYGHQAAYGISFANVVTSLLFTGAHLLSQPAKWALLVIIPSLLFGWFRDRHQSILPATILHCSYNLAFFTVVLIAPF